MRLRLPPALLLLLLVPLAFAGKAGEIRTESFRLLGEGAAEVSRGEYAKAVETLRRVTNMTLNSYRAWYYLGLALSGNRRYDEAIEALNTALELDPIQLQAHVALGDAYLKLGDLSEAEAAYYRALKIRPEFANALEGLGRLEEAKADEAKAVQFYERAIASNRGFPEAYASLGDLYLRRDRLDEAVRLLKEAVSVRPDFAPGLNLLAQAYARLGLQNEAIATIRKAIELEPKNAGHRATLGRILLDLGLTARAEEAFREAIERDPGLPEAREGLAELDRRRGDYAAAIAGLDAILADDRTDDRTARRVEARRVELVVERDRLAALAAAADAGGGTPEELAELARIEASRGKWERAAALQERAASTDVAGREALAWYRMQAGRFREAHAVYADLARETGRADLAMNDGVALARLGDDAGAVEAYRRAVENRGAPLEAYAWLGNSLYRTGKRDEAVKAYAHYLEAGGKGDVAERVRRVLAVIAPDLTPQSPPPPPFAVPTGEAK